MVAAALHALIQPGIVNGSHCGRFVNWLINSEIIELNCQTPDLRSVLRLGHFDVVEDPWSAAAIIAPG